MPVTVTLGKKALFGGLAAAFAGAAAFVAISQMDSAASPEVKTVRQDVRALLPMVREVMDAVPADGPLPLSPLVDAAATLEKAENIGRQTDLDAACDTLTKLRVVHGSALVAYIAAHGGRGPVDIRPHSEAVTSRLPSDKICGPSLLPRRFGG